jgi:hypothetical protein
MASRARANEGRVADDDELSRRFFEGTAAGAILIGEPPTTGPYLTLFDWPEAVVATPFDSRDIAEVIAALEAYPERRVRIRGRRPPRRSAISVYRGEESVLVTTGAHLSSIPLPRRPRKDRPAHSNRRATDRIARGARNCREAGSRLKSK